MMIGPGGRTSPTRGISGRTSRRGAITRKSSGRSFRTGALLLGGGTFAPAPTTFGSGWLPTTTGIGTGTATTGGPKPPNAGPHPPPNGPNPTGANGTPGPATNADRVTNP